MSLHMTKKCADFGLKMHQKRLTARLFPDLQGSLQHSPRHSSWI